MNVDKRKILEPNSGFERQEELLRLFTKNIELTEVDCDVLRACTTEVPETIGLIGCLLQENSNINNARLLIASSHQYNNVLSNRANQILKRTKKERNSLIDKLSDVFLCNTEEITGYEDKIYYILFGILSNQKE